jgi:very-short-patch-repair endonuclease
MLRRSVYNTFRPKTKFARQLRIHQTPGEKILWEKIRAQRFHRLKFRRQVPLGPYIVDFVCVERKLIIEIDGDSHYESGAWERDEKREEYLRKQGFEIIRFGNMQTVQDIDAVLAKLRQVLGIDSD